MPQNPGSALYAGSADEFVQWAPAGRLTSYLRDQYRSRYGRAAGESEVTSWHNSLGALASVVGAAALEASGVGCELRLPVGGKRIDASFVARDRAGQPHVVLVELKQWSEVGPSMYPEMVRVGATDRLHPSAQVLGYADALRGGHSAFTRQDFGLSPCAYLHNMRHRHLAMLRGVEFEGLLADAPLFSADDTAGFTAFLEDRLGQGDGLALLPQLTEGRYALSKRLMDNLVPALNGSRVWTLLDEQREAFNVVRGYVARALASTRTKQKAVVIITGGPGTGKSVIAVHLLAALGRQGKLKVAHATGSKAFTTNLWAVGGRESKALFRYFNNFREHDTVPDELDVLVLDEAHRIRETSNDRFTPRDKRSTVSQVRELIRAAKVSVFFLDERQNVRPGEIGTVEKILEGAREEGVEAVVRSLDGQFRCNGCAAYVDWVGTLFSDRPAKPDAWRGTEYELDVVSSPRELEERIRDRAVDGATGRLVAGYCWEWSDPKPDGTLVPDVVIGEWRRPWNEKSPEQRKTPGSAPRADRSPYYQWATQAKGLGEVGCIYSAQGFEFDYCGVILGQDLVWRDGWHPVRAASFDNAIKMSKKHDEDALRGLLSQTYRVLMTRGMKGTFLYSTDPSTRDLLTDLLG